MDSVTLDMSGQPLHHYTDMAIIHTPSPGTLIVVVASRDSHPNLGPFVGHALAHGGKRNSLTVSMPHIRSLDELVEFFESNEDAEKPYPEAILVDEIQFGGQFPEETVRELSGLAQETGMKIVLLTPYVTTSVIKDADLLVEVQMASDDDNHVIKVLKKHNGTIATMKFSYNMPVNEWFRRDELNPRDRSTP
jgi:hypothetical protein